MKFCNFQEKFFSPKIKAIDLYRYFKKVRLL
ncbi:hypothetical protein T01_2070 [Trichinella spiralis]|uniref:Uncharacterized protein n=1 Tax=Trichinella spiralis TaxID=6334 RepID=A0A0V0YVJ7_TRISP|nr:hypothetical protein T01_2070 [Trichinella spiralis]